MSCVMQSKGEKTGSVNMSENSSNKAEIYGSLIPGARGVRIPSYSPSSISLAPIARRLPDGHNNVNQAALWDLQTVFNKERKEHSSTKVSHNDEVPSTTQSPNIADLAYQSMVGFVLAKNGIPRTTGEGNQSKTTHECAFLPGIIAPSKATILKCTRTRLVLRNTYPSAS